MRAWAALSDRKRLSSKQVGVSSRQAGPSMGQSCGQNALWLQFSAGMQIDGVLMEGNTKKLYGLQCL
eukprot:scaffold239742_cov42-Prasinocladus_malaysianus.AAC.1